MMKIFTYEGRKIGVEQEDRLLQFMVTSPKDIDLALYYVSSHPGIKDATLNVSRVDALNQGAKTERFIPNECGIPGPGNCPAYGSRNYVLLRSGMKHSFLEIVRRYALFFGNLEDQRRKKVTLLDFDYEILSLLTRIPFFTQKNTDAGFSCQFNNGNTKQNIDSIMFQCTGGFTNGLKRLFGHESRYRIETNLEERIAI